MSFRYDVWGESSPRKSSMSFRLNGCERVFSELTFNRSHAHLKVSCGKLRAEYSNIPQSSLSIRYTKAFMLIADTIIIITITEGSSTTACQCWMLRAY